MGATNMIDWIPVDVLGRVLVELLIDDRVTDDEASASASASTPHSSKKDVSSTRVYHAVNPNPTPWSTLLPPIIQSLQASSPSIELSPFHLGHRSPRER